MRALLLILALLSPVSAYADAFSSTPPPTPPDGSTITVSAGHLVANNTGCSSNCTFTGTLTNTGTGIWTTNQALSGAGFSQNTGSDVYQNQSWSGTVTGSPVVSQNTWSGTSTVAGAGEFALLAATAGMGALSSGNLYALDVSAQTVGALTTSGQELHGGRFNASAFANMAGSVGNPSGYAIGLKSSFQITSGGTYVYMGLGDEITANNASPTTQTDYGMWVENLSSVQALSDEVGISIDTGGGAVGWTSALSFGNYARGPPCGSVACTLIYGQGALGAAFTAANGIDWHLGTFSGNAYNDGHLTISGSGNLATTGTIAATGNGSFASVVTTATSTMQDIHENVAGNWRFTMNDNTSSMLFKSLAGTNYAQIGPGSFGGLVNVGQVYAGSANLVLGSGVVLANAATGGFIVVPAVAGTPTGTAGAAAQPAIVIDTTNKKLCYNTGGTWECSAAFTP